MKIVLQSKSWYWEIPNISLKRKLVVDLLMIRGKWNKKGKEWKKKENKSKEEMKTGSSSKELLRVLQQVAGEAHAG
jgi:hypothetical protein